MAAPSIFDFPESAFVDAAACGDLDHVNHLLASTSPFLTAEVINKVDKDGKSAFHYACLNDDANLLRILLADDRVDVRLVSRNGDSGFHMAALYSSLKALEVLHADGRLNVNAQNQYGETPLHLCAGSGDKSAHRTADLLLHFGADLTVTDKWGRGPKDVSHDNAENPIVETFNQYLSDRSRCSEEQAEAINKTTSSYRAKLEEERAVAALQAQTRPKMGMMMSLGGLKGVQLKKTETVVKAMFKADEGKVTGNASGATADADGRKALSKLIDFPGDLEAITRHVANVENVNPGGADSYGLTALHKFASWNKTDYIELILPALSPSELNAQCPEGKTALHYAVEMASVAAIKVLVAANIDRDIKDNKGRTVQDILDGATASGVIERIRSALA
ncbi:hypothetical protein H310_08096 [Aphanomyces invadans]|uniref:Uncharacterized protein n=1 Tax=Aphanomyces invadans TaxID=157072 RepID=A0A024TZK9_9STRA|nr:hypothetical protein H310_08096 [Aphanomyces invadans]ETV99389.1 hypothetical protein H310_08096 [Aphanomyces invadans]|eukprot:XP_008871945.1 hypothetical protein H310_08096 [Aphanomyces invadans]